MTDFYDQASEHEEKYRELAVAHATALEEIKSDIARLKQANGINA